MLSITEVRIEKYTKLFIEKSNRIHNKFYNYDKVDYITASIDVVIICPVHGDFFQKPYNHLIGKGCNLCSIERNKKLFTKTKEQFRQAAMKVHNTTYNYDKSNYINDSHKLIITCLIHGDFWQSPNKHLRGSGCNMCKNTKTSNTFIKKHSILFMKIANKIHNNYYDYSKSKYKSAKSKIIIICPKHGEFQQQVSNHLCGKGCSKCSQSLGEKKIENYLIEHNIQYECEKRFKNCTNKSQLPFDFYINAHNLLIEFDGIQHYESIKFFGGDIKLKYTQTCDKIKDEYCKSNNIHLLRIPYFEISNINDTLDNFIKNMY